MPALRGRIETDWGPFTLEWSRRGLRRLLFPGAVDDPGPVAAGPAFVGRLGEGLTAYLAGEPVALDAPLDVAASPFAADVAAAARRIGHGQVATYGQVARAIGRPRAARAVGAALGANPVPLVVPCHRVVGAGGALVGFSAGAGLGLKERLLELEGALPARPPTSIVRIATPDDFHFEHTVRSHGWYDLRPFGHHRALGTLHTALEVGRRAVSLRLAARPGRIEVEVHGPAGRPAVERAVRRMFQLDRSLSAFHARTAPTRPWIAAGRHGRFLAAPTAFEDAVKTLLSINTTWAALRRMVDRLVRRLGRPAPGGLFAFPGPERLAAAGVDFLTEEIRVGYRAPYLDLLARRVASGALDPEGWDHAPTATVEAALADLPGFGPYARANLLRCLGRFESLGLDSWLRARYRQLHPRRRADDAAIERTYRAFGEDRGLVLWLDMTRAWHDSPERRPF